MSADLWRFIVFGVVGIFGEVVFTSLLNLVRDRSFRLKGFSFLWMFPIYGVIAFIFEPVHNVIGGQGWFFRGLSYMLIIYGIEYAAGALLKKIAGGPVWHYKGRYQLHGHINFFFAPLWFFVGLLVERYYGDVMQLSLWLARHFG